MDRRHLPDASTQLSEVSYRWLPYRPVWSLMTPDGGPTWPDDKEIVRWRGAAFGKGRRYQEEEDVELVQVGGMFGGDR